MSDNKLKEELLSRFDLLRTEYIKLINDKDVLINWEKPQLEALYSTKIGVYLVEELQLQLYIKALKQRRIWNRRIFKRYSCFGVYCSPHLIQKTYRN